MKTSPDSPAYRYLALGDSYTIGEGVPVEARFPVLLTRALRAQNIDIEEPLILARTGWTTGELSAAVERADLQGPYSLVTLLIGVNNQYRGYDIDKYRIEFRLLLQRSIGFAGGEARRVLVISIPDWGATPFAAGRDPYQIAREIDAFNAVNQAESQRAGARYVDVTGISRLAIGDRTLLAADGLHPSERMYSLWVEAVMPEAAPALQK